MNANMKVSGEAETVVRRTYHAAEGNVLDVQEFVELFTFTLSVDPPRRARSASRL